MGQYPFFSLAVLNFELSLKVATGQQALFRLAASLLLAIGQYSTKYTLSLAVLNI